MSRREGSLQKGEGRGPGLAIGAMFVVLCLGVTLLVLVTTDACESDGIVATPPPEPFIGAGAALSPLGWRDSQSPPTGPAIHAAPSRDPRRDVERLLESRGYLPAEDAWHPPDPLPVHRRATGLDGQCGVVALAADGWASVTEVTGADGDRYRPGSGFPWALVAACGDSEITVDGSGMVHSRSFTMPGLTPADVERLELPLDALLAHAEAEAFLGKLGWRAADELVVVEIAAGATPTIDPPAAPGTGCVPWVAVGVGAGHAIVRWDSHVLDEDLTDGRAVVGAVSCAPDGATPRRTPIDLTDLDGDGGRLFFRAYAAVTGPVVAPGREGVVAHTVGSLRVVDAAGALPDSVPASP